MLRLAVPVVVIQVGIMAMGVVDTIMIGHISAQALAAVALGNLYFFGLAIFAMGTLMVLDPGVAQAVGASGGVWSWASESRLRCCSFGSADGWLVSSRGW